MGMWRARSCARVQHSLDLVVVKERATDRWTLDAPALARQVWEGIWTERELKFRFCFILPTGFFPWQIGQQNFEIYTGSIECWRRYLGFLRQAPGPSIKHNTLLWGSKINMFESGFLTLWFSRSFVMELRWRKRKRNYKSPEVLDKTTSTVAE